MIFILFFSLSLLFVLVFRIGPMIGLFLIGVGTGGIKPCVSAFGGDQFSSEQEEELSQFFSVFYFVINSGSLLSTLITPLLRSEYIMIKCSMSCRFIIHCRETENLQYMISGSVYLIFDCFHCVSPLSYVYCNFFRCSLYWGQLFPSGIWDPSFTHDQCS